MRRRPSICFTLKNEAQTLSLARCFAESFKRGKHGGVRIHLSGDLGTGKTTFSRGLIQGLGYQGKVKSPTYTLIEPYPLADMTIHHLDLYRLGDPEELEYLGIDDICQGEGICLIEWPQRGEGLLAAPDLDLELTHLDQGRKLVARPHTAQAEAWLDSVQSHFESDPQIKG